MNKKNKDDMHSNIKNFQNYIDDESDEEDEAAQRKVNRQIRSIKRNKRIRAITILILIVAIAGFLYFYISTKTYSGYEVMNTVDRTMVASSQILKYGNYFLTYSADGIHCTDNRGNDIWSCPFEMQNPMVEICGEYVAVADYDGRTIYVFNYSGETTDIQTSYPIRKIKISAKGVVAAIVDGEDITPIYLYYNGEELASFRTTMAKSGYPVAIGISDDSKLVGISYLYLNNGELTTKVAFYNFGEVGQNETDNLVSGYDYQGEVVPVIEFLDDSTSFAVANDRLMFYEGKERPANTSNILLYEKVKAVYYGDGYVGLVFNNTDGESKYKMDLYSSNGKLENTFYFDLDYREILIENNRVVIYNSASAIIYTLQGNIKYQGDFEESVALMIPTNTSTRYIIVTNDEIKTIILK